MLSLVRAEVALEFGHGGYDAGHPRGCRRVPLGVRIADSLVSDIRHGFMANPSVSVSAPGQGERLVRVTVSAGY
jgi:hypothetical protein